MLERAKAEGKTAGGAAKDGEFDRGGWSIVGKRAVVVFTRAGLRMMKAKQLECCRMCRMPVRRRRVAPGVEKKRSRVG